MKRFGRRRTSGRERGVTMIELMVTLGILSVGILGVTSMSVQSGFAVQSSAEIALATNLATATLDEIQVMDFYLLPADGTQVVLQSPYFNKYGGEVAVANAYFTVTATVTATASTTGWKDILVNVEWTESSTSATTRNVQIRGRMRP